MKRSDQPMRKGILTSAFGIVANLMLAAAKITVGLLFGLVSVVADGFNNFSDCGSSAVSLVSFYISEKPADREHPYGHRRAEYIAAMVTGFLVLFLAVELVRESIEKIVANTLSEASLVVFIVLALSVAVKAGMFLCYRVVGKKINSDALKAAAVDSLCDCIATTAVILGLVILQYTGFPADGWAGVLVALFIVWQGIKILLEASSKLLGQAPEKELLAKLKEQILARNEVLAIHDLRVFGYGKGASYATVHVEMDASIPALESHAVLDAIEQEVKEALQVSLTAHLDPIDLQDEEALALEKKVRALAKELAEELEIHDFRIIRGATDKAIFDVTVPFSCKKKDETLKAEIEALVTGLGDYVPVITVERE